MAAAFPQNTSTLVEYVTVCAECGVAVAMLSDAPAPGWKLWPCGHVAALAVRTTAMQPLEGPS